MNNKRLFELREYNDLYQKDIAQKLGISQQTYSMWENGTKTIPLKHLNSLCNTYNVSMDYLLGLSDIKNGNKIKNIKTLNKKIIGSRIRLVRSKNKLTTRNLSDYLNTTPSTISAYETGKTLIITSFAYQICKKYKVSMDWLCGRID